MTHFSNSMVSSLSRRNVLADSNLAVPCTIFNLALLRQLSESASQLGNDFVLPATQFQRIDTGLAEGDTVFRHGLGFVDDLRCMQQRFRRNTADIQANTTDNVVALNEDNVQTQIGGPERRCV